MSTVAVRSTASRNDDGGALMESVLIKGDLSKLTPQERSDYYMQVCRSVGLNPLTKPFEYITLNGKLTLYALRTCTDQLRTVHGVSVEELAESEREGVFIVTAKVRNKDGRTDIAKGAVTITNLKGDALANAMMKAETKAKRRATLSICGLGFLDETEIETIPAAAKRENPHVTRPADIVPEVQYDEQGQPVDNIPLGDERIEPLNKAKARPEFASLQMEMRKLETVKAMETWGRNSADRVASLPGEWAEILRGMYSEQMADLRAKAMADNVQAG